MLVARRARALTGTARLPGARRTALGALALSGLAVGTSRIAGLPGSAAVGSLAAALAELGVEVVRTGDAAIVHGRGIGGLAEPGRPLELAAIGPLYLLMGMLAGHPFTTLLTGAPALRDCPLGPVLQPLAEVGAHALARAGDRLPVAFTGTAHPMPIDWRLAAPSPAVAAAVLLAGLHAPGETTVVEPGAGAGTDAALLRRFGATVTVADTPDGLATTVGGQPELTATTLAVPGDPALAAVALAVAAILPGSTLTLTGVAADPGLAAFLETLAEMGADLTRMPAAADPAADLEILLRAAPLRGVAVPAERLAALADSLPALAVAAACADGPTVLPVAGGRLDALAAGLTACGVRLESAPATLTIHGTGRPPAGGCAVTATGDPLHALALLALGSATAQPVRVDAADAVAARAPGFVELLNGLGARLGRAA